MASEKILPRNLLRNMNKYIRFVSLAKSFFLHAKLQIVPCICVVTTRVWLYVTVSLLFQVSAVSGNPIWMFVTAPSSGFALYPSAGRRAGGQEGVGGWCNACSLWVLMGAVQHRDMFERSLRAARFKQWLLMRLLKHGGHSRTWSRNKPALRFTALLDTIPARAASERQDVVLLGSVHQDELIKTQVKSKWPLKSHCFRILVCWFFYVVQQKCLSSINVPGY